MRMVTSQALPGLSILPDELLLRVLYYLDIPELLATSRVSSPLRLQHQRRGADEA
jgi:hypothetical protein